VILSSLFNNSAVVRYLFQLAAQDALWCPGVCWYNRPRSLLSPPIRASSASIWFVNCFLRASQEPSCSSRPPQGAQLLCQRSPKYRTPRKIGCIRVGFLQPDSHSLQGAGLVSRPIDLPHHLPATPCSTLRFSRRARAFNIARSTKPHPAACRRACATPQTVDFALTSS
jgi:hypothetical protein